MLAGLVWTKRKAALSPPTTTLLGVPTAWYLGEIPTEQVLPPEGPSCVQRLGLHWATTAVTSKAGFEAHLGGNLQRKGLLDRWMWSAATKWIQGFDNSSGISRIRHEETTDTTSTLGLHLCDNLVALALLWCTSLSGKKRAPNSAAVAAVFLLKILCPWCYPVC